MQCQRRDTCYVAHEKFQHMIKINIPVFIVCCCFYCSRRIFTCIALGLLGADCRRKKAKATTTTEKHSNFHLCECEYCEKKTEMCCFVCTEFYRNPFHKYSMAAPVQERVKITVLQWAPDLCTLFFVSSVNSWTFRCNSKWSSTEQQAVETTKKNICICRSTANEWVNSIVWREDFEYMVARTNFLSPFCVAILRPFYKRSG